jgi:hypothetical protein
MSFVNPFKQENVINTLLDAYAAGKNIRKANIDEEMLRNAYNINPEIAASYDKDTSILGSIFGTGLRNQYKGDQTISPSGGSTMQRQMPVNQFQIPKMEYLPRSAPKEELTKDDYLSGISTEPKKTVAKKPAQSILSSMNLPRVDDALKTAQLKDQLVVAPAPMAAPMAAPQTNNMEDLGNKALATSNNITSILANMLGKK